MKGIRVILGIFLLISCSVEDIQANQANDVLGATQSLQSIEAFNLSRADWPWAHGCSCSFNDIVNGDDGDLYVTGTFSDTMTLGDFTLTSRGGYDIFIGKVQSTGEWDWVVQAGGGGNDQGRFVAKAGQFNIVVYGFFAGTSTFGSAQHTSTSDSGSSVGTGSNRDLFISLLDEDGVWQWTKTAGGSNGYGDEPGGLAVDSQSNIYIAGSFVGDITLGPFSFAGDGNFDGFIAKLTPEGSWAFANHIGGNYNQEPMQLSMHNGDGVIVYGEYTRQAVFDSVNISTDGDRDVFVAKVELSGAWEWISSAGGPHRDDASAVDVDSSGNILVAGMFRGQATFGAHSLESPVHMEYEAFLAKLTPDGEWTWSLMIDKAPDTDLRVRDIKFNPKDDILIAGEFEEFLDLIIVNLTAENRDDLFFGSIGQDGQWHWGVAYGGNGWDSADVVSIDDAANIYIGGNYDYSIQIEDHFLNQTNDDGDGSFVGLFQLDTDGDGYNDGVDDLPNDPEEWSDVDGDGVGDNTDAFPQDSSEWLDSDGDGVGDNSDRCEGHDDSIDIDNDDVVDGCDDLLDNDGDGVSNDDDVFPEDGTESIDTDLDGIGDNSDPDIDGDGYANDIDDFPTDKLRNKDSDGDGISDFTEGIIEGQFIDFESGNMQDVNIRCADDLIGLCDKNNYAPWVITNESISGDYSIEQELWSSDTGYFSIEFNSAKDDVVTFQIYITTVIIEQQCIPIFLNDEPIDYGCTTEGFGYYDNITINVTEGQHVLKFFGTILGSGNKVDNIRLPDYLVSFNEDEDDDNDGWNDEVESSFKDTSPCYGDPLDPNINPRASIDKHLEEEPHAALSGFTGDPDFNPPGYCMITYNQDGDEVADYYTEEKGFVQVDMCPEEYGYNNGEWVVNETTGESEFNGERIGCPLESEEDVKSSSDENSALTYGIGIGVIVAIIVAIFFVRKGGGSILDESVENPSDSQEVEQHTEQEPSEPIFSDMPPENAVGMLNDDGYYWIEWPIASGKWCYRAPNETNWTLFEN